MPLHRHFFKASPKAGNIATEAPRSPSFRFAEDGVFFTRAQHDEAIATFTPAEAKELQGIRAKWGEGGVRYFPQTPSQKSLIHAMRSTVGLSSEAKGTRLAARTAHDLYVERQKDIQALLRQIEAKLKSHAQQETKDPENWGFSGDLGNVFANLTDINQFLH